MQQHSNRSPTVQSYSNDNMKFEVSKVVNLKNMSSIVGTALYVVPLLYTWGWFSGS